MNGLRAIYKKGLIEWIKDSQADLICLQEIKIQTEQIPPSLSKLNGYYCYFNCASSKGYSGVAVFSKQKPLSVKFKLGLKRFDDEGRIIELKYPNLTFISLYMPHGGRNKENLGYKLESYKTFFDYLKKIKDKNIIITGDFNIAHKEIDLARPKDNFQNTMFTKEERKQINKLIKLGFTDTFRKLHKEGNHFTWWPYFVNARQRNLGWRIDYIFISKNFSSHLQDSFILNKVIGSDHCPVGIEI